MATEPPSPLPPPATFLPGRVRNWLTARYLADPNPARCQLAPGAAPEPVVFVRFEEFAAFLTDAGVDLLPNLDAWRAAGWFADMFAELRPSDNPNARPPDLRLNLPPGDHRLVGIRRAVLDAPTERPTAADRAAPPSHLQRIDAQAAAIDTRPPRGLDPELADAYVAIVVAFRECTRLIDSAPALWEDAAAYRRLAAGVHVAADAARKAFAAVDIRLRRAGGPHVMRDALNDVLAAQAIAPLDPGSRRGGLNAVVTGLFQHGEKLFERVDGRGLLDRLRDQLARVPPEPAVSPAAARQSGDAPPAEQFGDAAALIVLARETWWWKAHRPSRGGADEADALNARMPTAEREAMRVVPFGTAGYDEWERRVKAVRAAFAELLRCGDHGPDRITRLDALAAAVLDLERAAVAARGRASAHTPATGSGASPAAGTVHVQAAGPPLRRAKKKRAEAEILVADWLLKNAKANPAAVTRDAVAMATGVSAGLVSKTAAWKAFSARRDAEAKPAPRDISLTDQMTATIPAGHGGKAKSVRRDALLDELIREQEADEAEQDRRHTRRHDPS